MTRTPLRPFLSACIPWLLALLLVGITVQVGLATAALLDSPSLLEQHRALAPWLVGIAAVAVAVALVSKDLPVAIGCGAVLLLLLVQGPLIRSLGIVRSLHAWGALLAFAVCLLLLRERLPLRK